MWYRLTSTSAAPARKRSNRKNALAAFGNSKVPLDAAGAAARIGGIALVVAGFVVLKTRTPSAGSFRSTRRASQSLRQTDTESTEPFWSLVRSVSVLPSTSQ